MDSLIFLSLTLSILAISGRVLLRNDSQFESKCPNNSINNPKRIDWQAGGVFVTPPGHWHAHVNESENTAFLLPIQDAGLKTYLRSLDIRFAGGLVGSD